MPVTGKIGEQGPGFTALFTFQRLIDTGADGVIGFRCRNNAFATGKLDAGLKGRQLRDSLSFDKAFIVQL